MAPTKVIWKVHVPDDVAGVPIVVWLAQLLADHDTPAGALYPRLMGSSWLEVAEPIRRAHCSGSTVHGRGLFAIGRGRSLAARIVASLVCLPRACDAADTRLVVTPEVAGERWLRTFGRRRVVTRQYSAAGGLLAERFGPLEFRFRLEPCAGSLLYRQLEAAVMWGPYRWPLPAACAPWVEAREDAAGSRRVCIHVRVTLPALGVLLTYDGVIDIEDDPA